MKATVQFTIQTTMAADELAAAVAHSLSLGGCPGRVGQIQVSLPHEGAPWPAEDKPVHFELGQIMRLVVIDGVPRLIPAEPSMVDDANAGTVTVVSVDHNTGVIRCSCPTCGEEAKDDMASLLDRGFAVLNAPLVPPSLAATLPAYPRLGGALVGQDGPNPTLAPPTRPEPSSGQGR